MEVPNKMNFFVWRCCNSALAVRRNLQRRCMRVDNVCGVCGSMDETKNHLFFRGELNHMFWFSFHLQLNSFHLGGLDFLESWENFCNRVRGMVTEVEIMQEFVFGLW